MEGVTKDALRVSVGDWSKEIVIFAVEESIPVARVICDELRVLGSACVVLDPSLCVSVRMLDVVGVGVGEELRLFVNVLVATCGRDGVGGAVALGVVVDDG